MPFVDRERVVIGGQSGGGILSVAVINCVGGWMGQRCINGRPEMWFSVVETYLQRQGLPIGR